MPGPAVSGSNNLPLEHLNAPQAEPVEARTPPPLPSPGSGNTSPRP